MQALLFWSAIVIAVFGGTSAFVPCHRPHEIFSSCVQDECIPTCQDPTPNCELQLIQYAPCKSGCVCEPGYVRDEIGICIPNRHCKPKCGRNEKYEKCPPVCESKCGEPTGHCEGDCGEPACVCKEGFVRDKFGDCIPRALCPKKNPCGRNEVWSDDNCVPAALCQRPNCAKRLPHFCPLFCTDGGCVCKKGFVRNRKGKCVLRKHCPRINKCGCAEDDDDCECEDEDCGECEGCISCKK